MRIPGRPGLVPTSFARGRHAACLLVVLLIAACTEPASCPLVRLAQTPLDVQSNLMFVPAGINGQPVRLLVNTGAERTILTEAAAARLGLSRNTGHVTRTAGIGGISGNSDAVIPGIGTGWHTIPDR